MKKNNKEEQLIQGILDGDSLILKEFYKKTYPGVRNYVLKNSGKEEDAEDVFQDALVLVYQKLKAKNLQLNCELSTYVHAVSKNIWLSKLRRVKKVTYDGDLIDDTEILDKNVIEEIEKSERINIFRKHFLKLNDKCREVLGLFFDGNSMKVIAEKMGFTVSYTRKKKFECKKELLDMIEKDPMYQELNMVSKGE
ncbi:sigma-70 family RNA polymerase sigma factor [Flavobacteriaceae bacterium R38]|nr:sigma-70 family RNA polymerase sigma factor [Flavobacteriaceae bacterium R38]